jgi:hypothetical protein
VGSRQVQEKHCLAGSTFFKSLWMAMFIECVLHLSWRGIAWRTSCHIKWREYLALVHWFRSKLESHICFYSFIFIYNYKNR